MDLDTDAILAHLRSNWKTSLAGFGTLGIAVNASIHFDASGHLAMTQKDWFQAAITIIPGLVVAGVGLIQQDAGTTLVKTAAGNVEVVDSHETPFDKTAKPIQP